MEIPWRHYPLHNAYDHNFYSKPSVSRRDRTSSPLLAFALLPALSPSLSSCRGRSNTLRCSIHCNRMASDLPGLPPPISTNISRVLSESPDASQSCALHGSSGSARLCKWKRDRRDVVLLESRSGIDVIGLSSCCTRPEGVCEWVCRARCWLVHGKPSCGWNHTTALRVMLAVPSAER